MASRRLVLLGLGAVLGACGFRPMLKQVEGGPDVRAALSAVEVRTELDRLGYLVRSSILEQINPTGVAAPTRYLLQVDLKRRTAALGIQIDNTVTRYNLTLVARFSLREASTQKVVYRSVVRRIASYNAIRAPYAELSAELDAERRAARDVGTDIRTQLAVYFSRQEAAA